MFAQHDGQPRHPTQLYEAAFHALAAVALCKLQQAGLFRGNLIKLYIIAYATYRFLTEFLREEQPLWLDLTGYQWSALAMIIVFGVLWWHDAEPRRKTVVA